MNEMTDVSIQGALSEDYTLTIAFSVIGFLLVAIAGMVGRHFITTLDEIKRELKDHSRDIGAIKQDMAIQKERVNRLDEQSSDAYQQITGTMTEMMNKMRSI